MGNECYMLNQVKEALNRYQASLNEAEPYQPHIDHFKRYLASEVEDYKKYNMEKDFNPDTALETAQQLVARYDTMIASVEDWKSGNGVPPLGVLVVENAKAASIPVAYCTDLWHHSTLAEPVNQLGNAKMIDADSPGSPKNWEKAYQTVIGNNQ